MLIDNTILNIIYFYRKYLLPVQNYFDYFGKPLVNDSRYMCFTYMDDNYLKVE